MNLAKLIAKFVKQGFAGLTDEEKTYLRQNKELLSPAQQLKLKQEDTGEESDEDTEDEDVDVEEDADEDTEDTPDDAVDEEALKSLISKSVGTNLEKKLNAISNKLVSKFLAGVAAQRKNALDTGKKGDLGTKAGEQTREFIRALKSGDTEKLKSFHAKTEDYLNVANDDDGGYLVPDELRAEVLRIAETEYGVARREFFYLPFSGPGNSRKIPTLGSSVSVSWTDEAGVKGKTTPTFGLVTQTLKKLTAIVPFTEEILEDSAINLTQLMAQLFAEAVAKEEDEQFFNGTGSPWTGIINNGSVNSVALGTGEGFSSITADKLLDMQDATPAGALAGAKYYLHRHALSVIRKLKDDNGAYIYQRPADGAPGTIWGYPYELVEAMPDNTTTGASKPIVLFGNLRLAAVFGDKQQIRTKLLTEASITIGETTINLAEQDMMALRVMQRVGYVLALPSAVTVLKTGAAS